MWIRADEFCSFAGQSLDPAGMSRVCSPFRTAETFRVEEIIDPRDTRKLPCEFARLAGPLVTPGPSAFTMRR